MKLEILMNDKKIPLENLIDGLNRMNCDCFIETGLDHNFNHDITIHIIMNN